MCVFRIHANSMYDVCLCVGCVMYEREREREIETETETHTQSTRESDGVQ